MRVMLCNALPVLNLCGAATHCNTLQHTATHCNTLQHIATHCNTLQYTATHCNTLQHTPCRHHCLQCNNGGGGGIFSKVKRLVRKCIWTLKRLFSDFLVFRPYTCGILEKQELFPRNYFANKISCAYLSLFMDCWNIQENLDSDQFWAGDDRFCGIFPPFFILAPRNQTLLDLRTVFAHFEHIKIWQLGFQKSYKVFMEPFYTIVTPYHCY